MTHHQLREDLSVYGSAPPVHQSYLSSAYYDPNSRTAFDELDEQKVKSEAENKEDEDEEDYYRRQQQEYEEKSRYGDRERDTDRERDRVKTPSASPPRPSPPIITSNLLQQQQPPQQQQPQPPPPPPPPPAPVHPFFSSSFSARSSVPPLHPKLISLKDKPSQERQQAIHKLLQQQSVVSVSSPEYEFSMGSSTSDGEPNTPSVSGKRHVGAPTEMSDITFTKEHVTGAAISTSSLTTQITQRERFEHPHYSSQQRRHRYANPYTQNTITGDKGKMHVTVYLPVHDLFIQCDVSNALMASSLIRIILQIYRQEHAAHLHPLLLDSHHNYQLYICEENGCVDDECPGLDPHCQLGTTGSCFFVLQHKELQNAAAYTQNYQQSTQAPPLPRLPPKKRPSLSSMSSASVASHVYSDESRPRSREHEHADGDYSEDADRSFHHEQLPQHRSSVFEVESGGAHFMEHRPPWWSVFICCAEQSHPTTEQTDNASHRRSSSAAVLSSPMSRTQRLKQKFKDTFSKPQDNATTSSSADVVGEQDR